GSRVRWAAASASFVNASGGLWRPDARFLQLLHGIISEFGAWRIATDDEHQDMLDVGIARGYVLEPTNEHGREGHHVHGIQCVVLNWPVHVYPSGAPAVGHLNEVLFGVVIVHHGPVTGLGPAIAEIESFADLYRGKLGRLIADG